MKRLPAIFFHRSLRVRAVIRKEIQIATPKTLFLTDPPSELKQACGCGERGGLGHPIYAGFKRGFEWLANQIHRAETKTEATYCCAELRQWHGQFRGTGMAYHF